MEIRGTFPTLLSLEKVSKIGSLFSFKLRRAMVSGAQGAVGARLRICLLAAVRHASRSSTNTVFVRAVIGVLMRHGIRDLNTSPYLITKMKSCE